MARINVVVVIQADSKAYSTNIKDSILSFLSKLTFSDTQKRLLNRDQSLKSFQNVNFPNEMTFLGLRDHSRNF